MLLDMVKIDKTYELEVAAIASRRDILYQDLLKAGGKIVETKSNPEICKNIFEASVKSLQDQGQIGGVNVDLSDLETKITFEGDRSLLTISGSIPNDPETYYIGWRWIHCGRCKPAKFTDIDVFFKSLLLNHTLAKVEVMGKILPLKINAVWFKNKN